MINRLILSVIALMFFIQPSFGQGLMNYKRFHSQGEFGYSKVENLVYAKAKTNYYLYKGSGANTEKSNYRMVSQLPLTLDLYNPKTSSKPGKRAVLILIPGGGRTGCLGVTQCNRKTIKQSGLYSNSAFYISQEGTNYNETAHTKARDYVKSGFVVLTLNTRYTYHDKRYQANGSNRWKKNGVSILNSGSAHLENMIVDVKRAIRWISHPSRASTYNVDPNNIFIQAGSGGGKMASLAAATPVDTFLADDPSHVQSSNSNYQFEVNNNNLNVPQKPLRGAILFAGDMNGTKNRGLISSNTGAIMLWHGTKDRSILHGLAETIEQRCEDVGCTTEFYSLANVQHGKQGAASFEHTDRVSNSAGLKTGARAHLHDFIVNHLKNGTDNRPTLSINKNKVKFNESSGRADIEINLSRAVGYPVRFTASADQMREVMNGKGLGGKYAYIQDYIAKDSGTTGPIAYDQGTGVAFEKKDNVTPKYASRTYHNSGPGNGNPIVIPASSNYHSHDFHGKKQVITIPAGQTKATFRVTLLNDTKYEKNECFKVRLLNANGARITNSVESITILDNENPNAGTTTPSVCQNSGSSGGTGGTGGGTGGTGGGTGGTGGGTGGNGGGTPTTSGDGPTITVSAPTKVSSSAITNTKITVTDPQGLSKYGVSIRGDNTAGVSNFNCVQTATKRVDCSLRITSSGVLKIKARDWKDNTHHKNVYGYTIN